ncbi:MAG: hypothetical protein JXR63_12875 [Spirochaetales bacterium]|nr:hypothetical protein [Spirochaetales bacterium]
MKLCIEAGSVSINLKKRKTETQMFLDKLFENLSFFTNNDIQILNDLIYLECDVALSKHEFLNKIQRLDRFLLDAELVQDHIILITELEFADASAVVNQITDLNSIYTQSENFNSFKDFLSQKSTELVGGTAFHRVNIRTELIENRSSLFFRLKEIYKLISTYSFKDSLVLSIKYDFFLRKFVEHIYSGSDIREISYDQLSKLKSDSSENIIYLCKLDDFQDDLPSRSSKKIIFYTNRIKDHYFSISAIEDFEKDELLFMYAYILISLVLPYDIVEQILSKEKLFPNYMEYFDVVKDLGLVGFDNDANIDLFLQDVKSHYSDLCKLVQDSLADEIFGNLENLHFYRKHEYLIFYFTNYFIALDKYFYILQIIKDSYENSYEVDFVNLILNNFYSLAKYSNENERKIVDVVLFVSEMNNSLRNGDEVGATIAYEKLKSIGDLDFDNIGYYSELARARYDLAYGRYQDSINLSKRALYFAEEISNFDLKSQAELLLGVAKLGQKDLSQALLYFDYALKDAKESRCLFNIFHASYYKALVHYLFSDFEEALEIIDGSLEDGFFKMISKAEITFKFLKAKIYFELGRFVEADILFSQISANRDLDFLEKDLSIVWSLRAQIYNKKDETERSVKKKLEQLEDIPDKFLVLAEYFYLRGKFSEALDSIEKGFDKYYGDYRIKFFPASFLYLKTGYFLYEDRVFKNESGFATLGKFFLFFKRYLQTKVLKKIVDPHELDINVSEILSKKSENIDPSNRIFLYLASEAIRYFENEDSLNRITLLNRSDKLLKDLLATIRTPEIKREFLHNNLWNQKIIDELAILDQQ